MKTEQNSRRTDNTFVNISPYGYRLSVASQMKTNQVLFFSLGVARKLFGNSLLDSTLFPT